MRGRSVRGQAHAVEPDRGQAGRQAGRGRGDLKQGSGPLPWSQAGEGSGRVQALEQID